MKLFTLENQGFAALVNRSCGIAVETRFIASLRTWKFEYRDAYSTHRTIFQIRSELMGDRYAG
uniref:Transposase n=1 Tax=Candidatus Kentrum sp. TC TaxID=2126339 RepID=A0A450ZXD7_9GAMM|nr:MAG: hypothetical protein BECKTC1821E_GA0114239_102829 [Candidatus Kentron sp. TC]VFK44292.1 MAG: hypothetical protein BECKTC1821D_GA0114238_102013 [Candidatus Kentron sp. TC]VFK58459.1 MAG: hypothetical protein BECKTC1821F_GA0114240_102426 [Candidatus Kentron sp. TC]